jgi:hypothetical protein
MGEVASIWPEIKINTICMAKALRAQKSLPQNSINVMGECGVRINPKIKTKSVKRSEKTNASGK